MASPQCPTVGAGSSRFSRRFPRPSCPTICAYHALPFLSPMCAYRARPFHLPYCPSCPPILPPMCAYHARPSCLPWAHAVPAHSCLPCAHAMPAHSCLPCVHTMPAHPAYRGRARRQTLPPCDCGVPFPPVMKFPPFLLTSRDVFSAFEGGEDARHALLCGAIRVNLGLGF